MDSFFIQESNDLFIPTEFTRGPWNMSAQHGAPPAALLGRALDRDPDKLVAHISFDILKPVPVAPLTVKSNIVKPGKRVELVEGALISDGHPVMRAKAWRIRTTELELDSIERPNEHPGPEEGRGPGAYFTGSEENDYLHAMEWKFITNEFLVPGPSVAWLRMRIPLIDGEEPSPLVRVLMAADSASGVSSELNPGEWLFINPDLNVTLHRRPEGEWICLDARSIVQPHGVGLAVSTVYDRRGEVGTTTQGLLIDKH